MKFAENFSRLLRDKWRGWSDADLESLKYKLATSPARPGESIRLTQRESNAFRDNPGPFVNNFTLIIK